MECARPFGGFPLPRHPFHYFRAQRAGADGFIPRPAPAPSLPGPLWTHGRPRFWGPLRQLGQPPSLPAPVSRNCGVRACCAWAWRCRYWQYASTGSSRCCCLPHFPAVAAVDPPSSARPSVCCPRRRRLAPRLLGWWWGFCLLPPPSILPQFACSCGGHSRGFFPLGQLSHSGGVVSLW